MKIFRWTTLEEMQTSGGLNPAGTPDAGRVMLSSALMGFRLACGGRRLVTSNVEG
jgi:hypothetical protein